MTNRLVLIDGECVLCSRSAQFIADRTDKYRFATIQSAKELKIDIDSDSVLLVKNGEIYRKSDAALEILEDLGTPVLFVKTLYAIPRSLRDLIYDLIAANRFRLFGKKKCRLENGVKQFIADQESVLKKLEKLT